MNYDTPIGVGGKIDNNTGQVLTGPLAGTPAGSGAAPTPPVSSPTFSDGATTPAPTQSPYYPRYTSNEQSASDYLGTFQPPKTQEQIAGEKTRAAQGQIDGLNGYYQQLKTEQQTINDARLRSTNSVSTLTGLAGSSEANVAANNTTTVNKGEMDKIAADQQAKIGGIMAGIQSSAATEAQQSRLEARQSAQDIETNRTQHATEAVSHLTNLAKSGVTAEGLKTTDPQSYEYLARNAGGEDQLKALMTLNRPQDQILDKSIQNGKYVIAYQNPLTGKVRIETADLGIPPGYSKTIDAGDRILAVPDNWNGDTSKLISINKGMTPAQAAKGAGGAGPGGQYGSDLDAVIGTTLSTIPTKFGQQTFQAQMGRARTDTDKINLVAAQVLKGQPAEFKNDFRNQAVGISEVDKAIKLLDSGVKTGYLENAAQYTFNQAGKDYDPKLAELNSHITAAIQPYRNSVTGAAWGDQEDQEYASLFGSTKYSPAELRQRLVNVKELLKSKSAEGLNSFVNPLGYYDNSFASGNLAPSTGGSAAPASQIQYQGKLYNVDANGDMTPAQ